MRAQWEKVKDPDSEAENIYITWQFNVSELQEKAENGEISYEQFLQAVDHKSTEVLENRGELFLYDPID